MTKAEIEFLFNQALHQRGLLTKLGVSRNIIYNWREKRTIPTLGEMLEVLFELKIINVTENG